jgi:hypothetical protein
MSTPYDLNTLRSENGSSISYLVNVYNSSTHRYLSSDQTLDMEARIKNIHTVNDKNIYIQMGAYSRIRGDNIPRNDGLWYRYDIYINGSETKSSFSQITEVGIGGSGTREKNDIQVLVTHTESPLLV